MSSISRSTACAADEMIPTSEVHANATLPFLVPYEPVCVGQPMECTLVSKKATRGLDYWPRPFMVRSYWFCYLGLVTAFVKQLVVFKDCFYMQFYIPPGQQSEILHCWCSIHDSHTSPQGSTNNGWTFPWMGVPCGQLSNRWGGSPHIHHLLVTTSYK